MVRMGSRFRCALLAATISTLVPAVAALAAEERRVEYNIEAGDLGEALKTVSRLSGKEVIFHSEAVLGKTAPRLYGTFTADEAVRALLEGTGLTAQFRKDVIIIRGRAAPSGDLADRSTGQNDIVVTGSRIRGAPSASPTYVRTQDDMRNEGQSTLVDVLRSIPQNFSGGQSPGVGMNVPESSGQYLGSGVGLNLRGLGPDATLTLLNGHRLPYNVNGQAIDVSAIPISAVSRMEIVADGASALYGSDAVGGVANIILKRDFEGLSTGVRFGASTDGGNQQQQYSLVGGTTWSSGGFLIAYDHEQDEPILARMRSYAATRSPGLTLFPEVRRHNVIASGHQRLTDSLSVEFDALYNNRKSSRFYALNSAGDYSISGGGSRYQSESFALAPSVRFELSRTWTAVLSAMYGEDRSHYQTLRSSLGVETIASDGCYCNKAKSLELSLDGPVFAMPGGLAKIAFGGGYRSNDFHGFRTRGSAQNISATQDAYYLYAELNLPLVSPEQNIPFLEAMNFSAAVRYEDYPGIDRLATPKLGLLYSPSSDFDIRLSWGKSFKVPTLYQLYSVQGAMLVTAASVGGSGYPASATVIGLVGGNKSLKPERATTWALTATLHPEALENLKIEASYYHINYRDRVVSPIPFLAQTLSDPLNSEFVNRAPTDAEKAAAIAGADVFSNNVGRTYDPADVVAIFYSNNVNASSQSAQGVDISIGYRFALTNGGILSFNGSGTYLQSSQRLTDQQPLVERSGSLFNPPKFRARGGVTWELDNLTLTSYLNHIGGVTDLRTGSGIELSSMQTVDLTARIKIDSGSAIFRGLDLILTAQNIFNAKPSVLQTTQFYEAPYDSTNYSPVGRFIGISITKQW